MEESPRITKPKPRAKTTPKTQPSRARKTTPVKEVVVEQEYKPIAWKKIGGSALLFAIVGGGAWGVYQFKEIRERAKEDQLEAVLIERGFSDAGISIEVREGGNVVDIACDTGKSVNDAAHFTMQIINIGELALQLPGVDIVDVEGKVLDTLEPKSFPIETSEQLQDFITSSERAEWCKQVKLD